MRYLIFLFITLLFVACSSKPKVHQLKTSPINEKDLGIGLSPTPPPNHQIPGEKSKQMLMQAQMQKTKIPLTSSNENAPKIDKNTSNPLSIMSSSGGILTLWALEPGNWIWGYTPLDAHEFGEAAFWRIISLPNGQVMIKNEEKGTCLQAYKNGVVHEVCDSKYPPQLWNLNFFDNQAIQIQSVSAKTCLQTPLVRTTTYYSIYLTKCAINMPTLDQQWYITPIINAAKPLFVIDSTED
ncbi:toxin [Campylobacter sp. MIT 21-1685]|uniref:cytolethal distending toxin subunit A/C n=1 Tax=unclassified Campylobacter TaxID=2593542 RepID=UPI00224AA72F|nr:MULTISPECIES: cytolethal distending toxin subunit A/C [unclassified Campylobacter]MCX2683707.1 toxin [Campylobacter sp. MIT 21-1684]MCX2751992.1 toxin [Campylobacter sp. MIT 21-1682]MCX2808191.1 toxin [Campylobacter sp. MIT 21-1685]